MNPIQIPEEHKQIIDRAVRNARTWGLGFTTAARADLLDYGITLNAEHERYIFNKHVAGGKK